MAESSGLQGLDALLKAKLEATLKEGFKQVSQLQNLLTFKADLDSPGTISGYVDRIVSAFSNAKGLISLNSSASTFQDHANTSVKGFEGMDLGHFWKHVDDKGNSCSQSSSRSARHRSRSPSSMSYGFPSNLFEGSVSRIWLGKGKQKCHELADCLENERFSRDKEPTISGKVKREKERAVPRRGKRGYAPTITRNVRANSSEAGNDIPPEDDHTWRKYGHKSIVGDDYPKMYYKCTFHRDRDCKATKTAQKQNGDPSFWQVRYTGLHSCQPQSSEIPLLVSNIQADGGGNSSSYSHNVDSSAERATAFTGHPADQMYRSQGNEKEVSADFVPSPQQNEGPSNCQAYLPPSGLSSASEANYMPSTNPGMQTGTTLMDLFKICAAQTSSASDADFLASKEMGMPPSNPSMQGMDTSESGIAAVASTTNSAVGSL